MRNRGKFRARCLALTMTLTAGAATAAPSRDWTKYPAVVQTDTSEDIYAIGDAHGDPVRMAAALAGAKLIAPDANGSDKVTWTGGRAVLVITGDLIDKGTNSLGVIALVRAVRKDAADKGGTVIVTMGNHEGEFLADPGGKKTSEFSGELTKAGLDPAKVGICDGDIGAFLCALPVGARVGDWFFAHAGNTGGETIDQIEAAIEKGFARHGFADKQFVGDNSILEARLDKKGPGNLPWFDLGKSTTDPGKVLAGYAAALGVKHIVQGHQYNKVAFPDGTQRKAYHFFQRYGLLFLIDTGMSTGINGSDSVGGVLRIHGAKGSRKATVICPDATEKTLWDKTRTDHESRLCAA